MITYARPLQPLTETRLDVGGVPLQRGQEVRSRYVPGGAHRGGRRFEMSAEVREQRRGWRCGKHPVRRHGGLSSGPKTPEGRERARLTAHRFNCMLRAPALY